MIKRMWATKADLKHEYMGLSERQTLPEMNIPVLVMSVEKARELFGAGEMEGQAQAGYSFEDWLASQLKENDGK